MNMKNFRHFLWFIALVGLITSCSRDEAAGPQNEASNHVRIGAGINAMTRAASVTIPANHKLRYVLEVWSTGTESTCIYRDEKATTEATAVAFDFVLTEAGNYKALLWADFVPDSETGTPVNTPNKYTHFADHYYVTNSADGLKAVTLAKKGADYVINDDARDAFFSCLPFEKGTGAFAKSVELTRPFGQINVIEKNTDLLAKVGTMTLTYTVPDGFSVETGATTGTANVTPTVSTLPTATDVRKANLFYDFIFAPATGQFTMTGIAMKFTSKDAHVTLPDYTIPANMPVVRNKRTNISGSILTANSNDVKLTVTVSDGWTKPDEEKDLDVASARTILDGCKTSGSGDMAKNYYYTISTAQQLTALSILAKAEAKITGYDNVEASYRVANYELGADIDLENKPWTPIYNFNGNFDGKGHTIRNMNVEIHSTDANKVVRGGLFDIINKKVSNLIVEGKVDVNGKGTCYAGGLCGILAGTIEFCRFNGTVSSATSSSSSTNHAGGIMGHSIGAIPVITGCIANAKVTVSGGQADDSMTGGLAGKIGADNISYSAWNSDPNNGGTSAMVGKNISGEATATNSFTDITGLNALLSDINDGVPASAYVWVAAEGSNYPKLELRTQP